MTSGYQISRWNGWALAVPCQIKSTTNFEEAIYAYPPPARHAEEQLEREIMAHDVSDVAVCFDGGVDLAKGMAVAGIAMDASARNNTHVEIKARWKIGVISGRLPPLSSAYAEGFAAKAAQVIIAFAKRRWLRNPGDADHSLRIGRNFGVQAWLDNKTVMDQTEFTHKFGRPQLWFPAAAPECQCLQKAMQPL